MEQFDNMWPVIFLSILLATGVIWFFYKKFPQSLKRAVPKTELTNGSPCPTCKMPSLKLERISKQMENPDPTDLLLASILLEGGDNNAGYRFASVRNMAVPGDEASLGIIEGFKVTCTNPKGCGYRADHFPDDR